jgi:23S rRNA pseudouridine1911/1915/1917 synthase
VTPLNQRILHEDNHLLIINKLAGELVQADITADPCLIDELKALIKTRDQKPGNVFLGAPHRLDRPVSGVVIFAKTSKALSRLGDMFRQRNIEKVYWAICLEAPAAREGTIVSWLKKNQKQNKSYVLSEERDGYKKAVLHYTHKASSDRYHLLEIQLETGRHHQIRAQLASIGCIIKGDLKYGAPRSNPDASISLHARNASFTHPVAQSNIEVCAPCPSDTLWNYFEQGLSED